MADDQDPNKGATPPADDNNGEDNKGDDSKQFSQEEVSGIVSKRLNEAKAKTEC
jgi:hypothetical protein